MPQTIVSPRAGLAQLKQVGFGLRRRVCTIRKPSPCLRNGLEACCKCHAWGLCTRRSLVKAPAAAVMPLRIAADARSRLALPAGCRCRRRRPRLLRVVGLCGRGPAARQEALPARLHRLPAGERRLRRAPGRAGGCPQPCEGQLSPARKRAAAPAVPDSASQLPPSQLQPLNHLTSPPCPAGARRWPPSPRWPPPPPPWPSTLPPCPTPQAAAPSTRCKQRAMLHMQNSGHVHASPLPRGALPRGAAPTPVMLRLLWLCRRRAPTGTPAWTWPTLPRLWRTW